MDKRTAAHAIISAALPLVPFEGWTFSTLQKAAEEAGYKKTDAIRVFPGGAIEAVDTFSSLSDHAMLQALEDYSLGTMRVRERISTIVRIRLIINAPYREAVRKVVALHAMPLYAAHGLKSLYQTVDTIWHAAGDTATDTNFYTKRLSLAAVYTSTLLHWLDDKTPGQEASWMFLERRIDNVMQIGKIRAKVETALFKRRA
jgi:ubiquinone biosynthesis protein COQ9